MKNKVLLGMGALIGAGFFATDASAVIYTFQQGVNGYSGATSTYTEYQPGSAQDDTFGGRDIALLYTAPGSSVEKKTAFMRYDLFSIATPVIVNSATVSLFVDGNPGRVGGYNVTYTAYAITRTGLNFGTVSGDVQDGALSFNYSSYSATSPVGWGTNNNIFWGPVIGEDYSSTAMGSFTLTSANENAAYVNFSLDAATVASWINNPSSNLGFVLVAEGVDGGVQTVFYTGNAANEALRPTLTLDVTPIPEPGVVNLLLLGSVGFGVFSVLKRRKLA